MQCKASNFTIYNHTANHTYSQIVYTLVRKIRNKWAVENPYDHNFQRSSMDDQALHTYPAKLNAYRK